MSEPDGNHGQGRWNDNSVNKMQTQTHSTLLGERGSCMKYGIFWRGETTWKTQKTDNFSQGRTCKSTLPSSQQPPKLTSEYEKHNFLCPNQEAVISCHQCIGWVRCLADRLIEGAYPWRQSASKVSGDAFTPWGGFFLEAFLLVQDRRLTYDVRILTCQTATSCVPHEAMGGVKTRLFVYGPLKGSAADVGVR